jgi:hypothetical protein
MLKGHERVWILFAHIYDWVNVDDQVLFVHLLDNLGRSWTDTRAAERRSISMI